MVERTLALVIDGEVVSVLKFDERTAAALLSNPEIIDITEKSISHGWHYNPETQSFYIVVDGNQVEIS